MSNKFVSHYNGKIVRTDLYDGLVVHKQESLPTTIYLPNKSKIVFKGLGGEQVMLTDLTFEEIERIWTEFTLTEVNRD